MNRREVLAGIGAGAAVLAGVGTAAADDKKGDEHHEHMAACAKACRDCAKACEMIQHLKY